MDDKKVTREIKKTVRIAFLAMSTVMVIASVVSFLALKGNEFSSLEKYFNSIIHKNAASFSNEIFLEQVEALDSRLTEVSELIQSQYPNTRICLEVNSIHAENAKPRQIAFKCHKDLHYEDLKLWGDLKLGENLLGNIKYRIEGQSLYESKIFRFIIIAFVIAIFLSLLTQFLVGNKLTDKYILPLIRQVVRAESEAERFRTMRKLAHDTEALIVVIENLLERKDILNEEERKVGKDSISRIRLLNGAALRGTNVSTKKEILSIKQLIENLVTEKRIQYQEEDLEINMIPSISDFFIDIEQVNVLRAFSNIIDNSIDATDSLDSRVIEILINEENSNFLSIEIKDNGKGIPSETLKKIQVAPFSYGKKNGNGLGLKNSMEIISQNQGNLEISSEEGKGTTIKVDLPFVKKVSLSKQIYLNFTNNIIVLDDTIEIHKTWKSIFSEIGFPLENLYCFTKVEDFKTHCKSHPQQLLDSLCFIDFDLGDIESGAELIKKYSLEKKSFLVTSYSNDLELVVKCEKQNIKVIPKKEIGNIQFHKFPDNKTYIVHLDDNTLLRKDWKRSAKEEGLDILSFDCSEKLFDNISNIEKNTLFFIDKELNEEIDGIKVLETLFKLGYEKLYLSTAHKSDEFKKHEFIKKIINKKFPSDLIDMS